MILVVSEKEIGIKGKWVKPEDIVIRKDGIYTHEKVEAKFLVPVVGRKHYKLVSLLAQRIPSYNSAKAFEICSERWKMLNFLPNTIKFAYGTSATNLKKQVIDFDFPVAIICSRGEILASKTEVNAILDALATLGQPILVEEYITKPIKEFIFFKGEIVKARERSNFEFWYKGGKLRKIRPTSREEEIVEETADKLKANLLKIRMFADKIIDVELAIKPPL